MLAGAAKKQKRSAHKAATPTAETKAAPMQASGVEVSRRLQRLRTPSPIRKQIADDQPAKRAARRSSVVRQQLPSPLRQPSGAIGR